MRRILVIGGSTRAAADSVRRAGWIPICADLFGDDDLLKSAEVIPVRHYPESLPDDVAPVRADGWMYCGALENSPQILKRVLTECPSIGPLLGCDPSRMDLLRNPCWLQDFLKSQGLPFLETRHQSSPPAADGNWIQKPLASAGGRLIRIWDAAASQSPFPEPHYFQRRAIGLPYSALLMFDTEQRVTWLGATRELVHPPSSHPPSPFAYCGSCGLESDLPSRVTQILITMARQCAESITGLRGIVGLDFRLDGDRVWLTEINPRYTASVEILELASGRSVLNPEAHSLWQSAAAIGSINSPADSFRSAAAVPEPGSVEFREWTRPASDVLPQAPKLVTKQILYAAEAIMAPDLTAFSTVAEPWQVRTIADIPRPATRIESGWPICTVMASGDDVQSVQSLLRQRIEIVDQAIRDSNSCQVE